MTEECYDVLIVGAGPSGAAAAITLGKQGWSVLLIDKHSFPRDKVCGDGLTGNSLRLLQKLGVWDDIASAATCLPYVEVFPENSASFTLDVTVHTFKREKLDMTLWRHAVASGARFRNCRFSGISKYQGEHLICEVIDQNSTNIAIKTKFVLLAAGCQGGAIFGESRLTQLQRSDVFAIRGYYKASWDIDHTMVFIPKKYTNGGYQWIFPMGNNEYNIGCGMATGQKTLLKEDLDRLVESISRQKRSSGKWITNPRGAFIRTNLSNLKHSVNGRILLSGEMLGTSLPITGEGIGMALETGILAAETVSEALKNKDLSLIANYRKRMLIANYRKRIEKGLKIKYLPYRMGYYIIQRKSGHPAFRSKLINTLFSLFLIRCIRFGNRISVKLSTKHL